MSITEYDTYSVPTWALPALFNGDVSGISEEDTDMIAAWEGTLPDPHMIDCVNYDEKYFTHRPAFGLACDCTDCTVYVNEEATE